MSSLPRISTREEVMFFDTDCGGVVHNIAYLRMIETCRTRLAATMGMQLVDMAESGEFPVVVRTEIDYKRPAKLGDWIRLDGWLASIGKASFDCQFELRRESDETLLVSSTQRLALVQMPSGRPKRLPKDWLEKYAELA